MAQENRTGVPLAEITVGMVIKLPDGGRNWVRVLEIAPTGDPRRAVVEPINGKRAGHAHGIALYSYSAGYTVRPLIGGA